MGKLRDQMMEDLQLRDYARGTSKAYVERRAGVRRLTTTSRRCRWASLRFVSS